jgi:ABC-type lipoprotein release transport system permease subunit
MLGIAAGRIIAAQLFEVHQADPLTIASVIAALLLVAWLAALAPAHQASRVDPAATLRQV